LATRVAVIADGRLVAYGEPEQILTGELLSSVYGVAVTVERTPCGRALIVPSSPGEWRSGMLDRRDKP
jgi:iron complex transport system ATP-binding protein